MKARRHVRRIGPVERLEPRFLLSGSSHSDLHGTYHPLIVAGDPAGSPPDSPALRVDPNTTTSAFAGVGSLEMVTKKGAGSCTATPIADRFILTAAHCVDLNDDGRSTKRDGLLSITFNLNYGSDLSHQITISAVQIHPDYTGFNRPSVNDDLAVLTLSSPLPAGVPFYSLYTGAMDRTIFMIGYGRAGDGVSGYTVPASDIVKRKGENFPDSLGAQDDPARASVNEVFTYDFDGPSGNGPLGGSTLGNSREATAGPGDSGGPSFVQIGGDASAASSYAIAGVNTFTIDHGSTQAPLFGSMAGGIIVAGYDSWIQAVLSGKKFNSGGAGGSGGRGGYFRPSPFYHTPSTDWQSVPDQPPAQVETTDNHSSAVDMRPSTGLSVLPWTTPSNLAKSQPATVPLDPYLGGSPGLHDASPVELHDLALTTLAAADALPDVLAGWA